LVSQSPFLIALLGVHVRNELVDRNARRQHLVVIDLRAADSQVVDPLSAIARCLFRRSRLLFDHMHLLGGQERAVPGLLSFIVCDEDGGVSVGHVW